MFSKLKKMGGVFNIANVIMAVLLTIVVAAYVINVIAGLDLGTQGNATRTTITNTVWTIMPLLVVVVLAIIVMYVRAAMGSGG